MKKPIAYKSAFIVINQSEQHFRDEHDIYLCISKKNWGIATYITLSTYKQAVILAHTQNLDCNHYLCL